MAQTYTDSNGITWTYMLTGFLSGTPSTSITACALNGYSGDILIPTTLGGYPVTALADNILNASTDATLGYGGAGNVSFDTNCQVVDIGSNFCGNTSNIVVCVIPDSVVNIGENAFINSSVSSVYVSQNITNTGSNLTSFMKGVTSTAVGIIVPFILNDAFQNTNINEIWVTSSAGVTSSIGTSPGDYRPFQNFADIVGTIHVTDAIDQALWNGVSGVNTGLPGVWDQWTIDATWTGATIDQLLNSIGGGNNGGNNGGGNIPCFPNGTRILTADGYKPVESLIQHELVVTADGRQVPVTIYSKHLDKASERTAPYLIPANSLGKSMPSKDIRLSPNHAFQLRKGLWMLPRRAAHLRDAVKQYGIGEPVTYYHLECPNYFRDNLVIEGGVIVESYAAKQNNFECPYTYNKNLHCYTRSAPASAKVATK